LNAPVKRTKRRVDGVLLLNKPVGITSNTALQIAKRIYNAEKAGHTGTLDPFADGLLPLCFGEATKFSQYQLEADKCYRALLQLGVTTTTGDPEGEVLQHLPVIASAELIQATVASFVGDRMQTPPMYSALKHQGKPLYEYARAGITIERPARPVSIRTIAINNLNLREATVDITVTVSAGTYIRTLAEDIGNQLGCGAHLTRLTRLASGGFQLAEAVTLIQLEQDDMLSRDARLAAADGLVSYIPRIQIDTPSAKLLMKGQHPLFPDAIEQIGLLRAYHQQQFLGLVQMQVDGRLIPQRLMSSHTLLETL
jgi:tRNA pseudouridine55 synthase